MCINGVSKLMQTKPLKILYGDLIHFQHILIRVELCIANYVCYKFKTTSKTNNNCLCLIMFVFILLVLVFKNTLSVKFPSSSTECSMLFQTQIFLLIDNIFLFIFSVNAIS